MVKIIECIERVTQPEHQTLSRVALETRMKLLKVNEKVVDVLYVRWKVLRVPAGRRLMHISDCSVEDWVH